MANCMNHLVSTHCQLQDCNAISFSKKKLCSVVLPLNPTNAFPWDHSNLTNHKSLNVMQLLRMVEQCERHYITSTLHKVREIEVLTIGDYLKITPPLYYKKQFSKVWEIQNKKKSYMYKEK